MICFATEYKPAEDGHKKSAQVGQRLELLQRRFRGRISGLADLWGHWNRCAVVAWGSATKVSGNVY